jgi:putative Mn2+ efflux pump MntP
MYEQLINIILISIVLGLDAFSLSLGMGLKGVSRDYEFRFALTVGLLHILMPLMGLNLGLLAGNFLGKWAGRLGAAVLFYIAIGFIRKGYEESRVQRIKFNEKHKVFDSSLFLNQSWKAILFLAVSVSVDALTVGFSLGTFNMPVLISSAIMGVSAGSMTLLGFCSGRIFGRLLGSCAQIFGGLILFILALKMLL